MTEPRDVNIIVLNDNNERFPYGHDRSAPLTRTTRFGMTIGSTADPVISATTSDGSAMLASPQGCIQNGRATKASKAYSWTVRGDLIGRSQPRTSACPGVRG